MCRCSKQGDESGRTQHGNNNAYCQDSPIAWLDWSWSDEQRALFEFTRELLRLRQTQPVFRRRHFFQGRAIHGPEIKDLYWIKADGTEMTGADWTAGDVRSLAMVLPGDQISEVGEQGERIAGETFALLLNAGDRAIPFRLGARRDDFQWRCLIDTAAAGTELRTYAMMEIFDLQAHSFVVFQAIFPARTGNSRTG